nr:transposase [Sphaerisporangium perillae]
MARTVKRALKFRFYPTSGQAEELARTFGCVRLVYNRALEERTRAYRLHGKGLSYEESSAALTGWKRTEELGFLSEVSSVPLQQALRHLQARFANFFAKRARYPVFKSRKRSRAAAEYTRSGFRYRDGELFLARMDGPLDIVWSRPLPEGVEPSTVTVSRDAAGRWFVSILCEETIRRLDPVGESVGIDAGISALVTLSRPIDGLTDGDGKIANPRHERAGRRRLAKAQRVLARKSAVPVAGGRAGAGVAVRRSSGRAGMDGRHQAHGGRHRRWVRASPCASTPHDSSARGRDRSSAPSGWRRAAARSPRWGGSTFR